MAKVVIELEDAEGDVQLNVAFSSDFDMDSNAHKMGAEVLKFLDTLAPRAQAIQDVEPREFAAGVV